MKFLIDNNPLPVPGRRAKAAGNDAVHLRDLVESLREANEGAERVRRIVLDLNTDIRGRHVGPAEVLQAIKNGQSLDGIFKAA